MQISRTGAPWRWQEAVFAPSHREGAPARVVVASLLVALGLFTVSWERLGNVPLGPYNVKLPVLLLSLAALLVVPGWARVLGRLWRSSGRLLRVLALVTAAIVVLYVLRALTAAPLGLGLAQVVAVGSGAIAPALAVLGVLASRRDVAWALRWFVAGAVVAGLFGLWQLLAFYTGLPQLISYTGVGTSGTGGRISSFSYEPAYFAYFLVLALGAVAAAAMLEARRVSWPVLLFFGVLLVLVNARSLLFLLPVLGVLLAVAWRRNRALLARAVATAAVLLALNAVVPAALAAVQPPAQVSPSAKAEPGASSSSKGTVSAPAASAAPAPAPGVLDPSEPSSNGPRIELYKAVLAVDLQHPLVGVGPGHLRDALATVGYVAPNQGVVVVANNVWLQAAADGGVLLLALEAALVVVAGVLWWRRRGSAEHALLSAWLAVVLVGGLLTSYFFDIKVWVVLALALVLLREGHRDRAAQAAPSASA